MIQNEMQSQIGLIEGRQGDSGTLSVGWGARDVWEGLLYYRETSVLWVRPSLLWGVLDLLWGKILCNTGKTFLPYYGEDFLYYGEGVLLYEENFLYGPSQHDQKQKAIPDWVNRRATRGYWNFVAWLRGHGRLGGFFVL